MQLRRKQQETINTRTSGRISDIETPKQAPESGIFYSFAPRRSRLLFTLSCLVASLALSSFGAAETNDALNGKHSSSDPAMDYLEQAEAMFGTSEPELAIEFYKEALLIQPDNPEIYYRLAVAREALGDIEEAIRTYETMKGIEPDGRWAGLARARLDTLRTRAALRLLIPAEHAARSGAYAEAKRLLIQADEFNSSPAVRRRIYERYYSCLAASVTDRLRADMDRRMYRSVAIAGFESMNSEDALSARFFSEMLRDDILTRTRLEVLSGPMIRDMFEMGEYPAAYNDFTYGPYPDYEPARVDCLISGSWGDDELRLTIYDLNNGDILFSSNYSLIGRTPPIHPALTWRRFPSPQETNNELWAWVWSDEEIVSPRQLNVTVKFQVNQPSYVILFLVRADGSLELLSQAGSEPERFISERQAHTIQVSAGRPGDVRGVWIVASRTSLVSWADISHAGPDATHIIINKVISELQEMPRRSWEVSRWTWYVSESVDD